MKRFRKKTVAAVAVVAALAVAPWTWLPAAAGALARHWLDLEEKGSSRLEVSVLSPFRLSARGLSVGAVPGSPSVDSIEARFTPWGLLRGRVDRIDAEGFRWDGEGLLPEPAWKFFTGKDASGRMSARWRDGFGYEAKLSVDALGGKFVADVSSDPEIRVFDATARFEPPPGAERPLPRFEATATAWIAGSAAGRPLRHLESGIDTNAAFRAEADLKVDGSELAAEIEASFDGGAAAFDAVFPSASVSAADSLVAPVFAAFAAGNVPPLSFSARTEGRFTLARGEDAPLPEWKAKLRVRDGAASAEFGEQTASLSGANVLFRASGLGAHVDIAPFGGKFEKASFGRFALDGGSMWFRTDLQSLLLTEGSVGFCGGTVRVYALHLAFASLNAGFTLFLDDLDAGEVVSLFPRVRGTATGKMHGKLPLSFSRENGVRLHDAFLYSPPGQIGNLRLENSGVLVDRLRETGVPSETCDSLETALEDLDYDVLRLDLSQDDSTGDGRLVLRLHGKAAASAGRAATPVDLNISFNGELQEAVNVGIRAAGVAAPAKKKGPAAGAGGIGK